MFFFVVLTVAFIQWLLLSEYVMKALVGNIELLRIKTLS